MHKVSNRSFGFFSELTGVGPARKEFADQLKILKMVKQEMQEECQKQETDYENRTVDGMKALLLNSGKAI